MKVLVLFACFSIPFASAGIGKVTPQVEAEALRLWNEFCAGAAGEGGGSGDLAVYCKLSPDVEEENLRHDISVTPRSTDSKQVIFVRPPSYNYNHDVRVNGGGQSGQKTVIYVLPAKNKQRVNIIDNTSNDVVTQKPTVFFLKKDHSDGSHDDDRDSQPAPPTGTYLPPKQSPRPTEDEGGYGYPSVSASSNRRVILRPRH